MTIAHDYLIARDVISHYVVLLLALTKIYSERKKGNCAKNVYRVIIESVLMFT